MAYDTCVYSLLADPGSYYGSLPVPGFPWLHRLNWDGSEVYRTPGYNTHYNTHRACPVRRSRRQSSLSLVDCYHVSFEISEYLVHVCGE